MKINSANREAIGAFLSGEHGAALLNHLKVKCPQVNWDAKATIEKYAICSAEARGWLLCMEEMIKVITPEEKS